MLRFLFDTDHVTLFQYGNSVVVARLAQMPPVSVGISPISMEEALRGRLAAVSRANSGLARIRAYNHLTETVRLFPQFPIVPFDQSCEIQFQWIRSLHLRIGTQDQKIAAVALANHLTLLTRNKVDFSRIPGLTIDDWSV